MIETSLAHQIAARLVKELGRDGAKRAIPVICSKFTTVELAALAALWNFWARPKQIAPAGNWRSWGFLGGRGFGKTRSCAEWINQEVQSNRAPYIGLAAQNEDKSIEIQVEGKSGLIATAPPWFKPKWHANAGQLEWPNGSIATVYTPEKPGNIRGPEFNIAWLCEIQSWPNATREEAFSNFMLATRLGYARTIWDATPKRGHPIIKELLARGKEDPRKHVVIRGSIYENATNLGEGVVADLERKYKNTRKGREELDGEQLDDSELAIAQQGWIDRNRRPLPSHLVRRGLGVDPAVTARGGSDRTGIVEGGLGVDGHGYVLADKSGKYDPPTWAKIVLDRYVEGDCDIIVVETNKGGNLLVANLRAAAKDRDLTIVVVGKDERPQRQAGIVFVKEVYSKGEKADRARPLSTAYEGNVIHHVEGADLTSLEDTLTTWEPAPTGPSPDDLDALNVIMTELLELKEETIDLSKGFAGLEAMARAIRQPRGEGFDHPDAPAMLAALLAGEDTRGGGI